MTENESHYDGDDCMRFIERLGDGAEFCATTAIKYAWRIGRKDVSSVERDVKNIRWYMDRFADTATPDLLAKYRGILTVVDHIAIAAELNHWVVPFDTPAALKSLSPLLSLPAEIDSDMAKLGSPIVEVAQWYDDRLADGRSIDLHKKEDGRVVLGLKDTEVDPAELDVWVATGETMVEAMYDLWTRRKGSRGQRRNPLD